MVGCTELLFDEALVVLQDPVAGELIGAAQGDSRVFLSLEGEGIDPQGEALF